MAAIGGALQPGTRLLMIQAIRHRPVWWIAAFVLGLALGSPPPAAGADTYTRAIAATPAQTVPQRHRDYWAFQPVQRSEAPPGGEWVRNPVDGFVLEALQAEGLGPAPEADRAALVRRAFLALVGLPPSPEEVREFVGDSSPDAYERLVERLLASPHYGERWGRHWLDLARFAESSGFERDVTRGNAWRYRDYVIAALNADKPYDRFVREQVAGDELWPDSFEARIATAFNRNYAEEGNQKDLLLARQETLHDITAVVGSTFLGLTYDCARCHDHKFDPITQKDYYRLQAFFANVNHDDRFPIVPAAELGEYRRKLAIWEERTAHIWEEMSDLLMPLRNYTPSELLARYPRFRDRGDRDARGPPLADAAVDGEPARHQDLRHLPAEAEAAPGSVVPKRGGKAQGRGQGPFRGARRGASEARPPEAGRHSARHRHHGRGRRPATHARSVERTVHRAP